MSTVCYCGQPDCPVTTWERDACVTNLRAERDALLAERDELRAQVDAARAYAHKTMTDDVKALRASLERANEGVRYWTDLAQAEARDAAALRARIAKMEDELAHEKGGRLDEAAIRAACEQETGAWPYGRIIDAVVSTLRAQQARWEAFVEAEAERAKKAEARVAELEARVAKYPEGR